ncbi:hypothetical protein SAY87_009904 [Trapa incisa]|uniref:Protein kinase domain-containing protein n=1 Tax=Trapa incisa TaxID=236973 RepID=A0AAN7GVJ2_9MYRT|nr:hypothetical protein SAY87_009904 [Trapa incisa]
MGSSAEETIYVAIGKNVERSKAALFGALDNFVHKKICLLHVHTPARSVALKLLEISCAKESNERKQLETELKMKRKELEDTRNQHTEVIKQLHSVQEKKPILDHLISESTFMVGELEEKILSAVELLITIKEGRDKIRAEHELVMLDVRELRKSVITGVLDFQNEVEMLS